MDKIAWLEEELLTLRGKLKYQHELAALRDDQLQKLREENKGLRALAGRLTDNGGRAGELDSTSEKADAATQTFVSPPCANKVARVTCAAQCYGPLCEKGSLVELPNCSHMIHLDCLMLTLAVTHSADTHRLFLCIQAGAAAQSTACVTICYQHRCVVGFQ